MLRMPGIETEVDVDARGLYCPLPILRLRRALRDRPSGSIATLRATDPAVVGDIDVFCGEGAYSVEESRRDGSVFLFRIRKR